jgi:ATP-dependent protease HslVU (ClpYQ) peptidase subunit
MTTIAYDGKTLAADTLVTSGDHKFGTATKIHKLDDGRVIAASGTSDFIHAVVTWLNGGDKPEMKEGDRFLGIVVYPSGEAKELSEQLRLFPACIPWATGSGEAYALTAMKCGKNAREAVEIAIQIDIYSGGQVDTYRPES